MKVNHLKKTFTDIADYEFKSFLEVDQKENLDKLGSYKYEFKSVDKLDSKNVEELDGKLVIERSHAREAGFKISPIVEEHRGIRDQEEREREERISEEVLKRVQAIEELATKRGYDEGVAAGREEVYAQTRASADEKLAALSAMISDVLSTQHGIISRQKSEIHLMIKNLTKWIILRELKDDGAYIGNLLEKLLIELQVKSNLLIRINQNQFEGMPEVFDSIKNKFGELTNVRLEVDYDIDDKGIVVESENGIIDGTLKQQFKNLDKLFESVEHKNGE